jgi:two-component system, cell cycle sensor histidine kinase and response regulator CckA
LPVVFARVAGPGEVTVTERIETTSGLGEEIAHDFNNLLLPILGYAQLALGQIRDDQPRLRGHVESIQHAAEQSRELVERLLALGGPERIVRPEPISLDAVVEAALPLIRMIVGTGVSVRHDPATEAPVCIADPMRLGELLLQLAADARAALPPSGAVVTITTARTAEGGRVTLACADNGSGADELEARFTVSLPSAA